MSKMPHHVLLVDGHVVEIGDEELLRSPLLRNICTDVTGLITLPFSIETMIKWKHILKNTVPRVQDAMSALQIADFLQDVETINSMVSYLSLQLLPQHLCCEDVSTRALANSTLTQMPEHLALLILQHRQAPVLELLAILHPTLHSLALYNCSTNGFTCLRATPVYLSDLELLATSLPLTPSITFLSLRLTDPSLVPHLTRFPALRHLDISQTVPWLPPSHQPLLPWLPHLAVLTQLVSLDVSGNDFQPQNSRVFTHALRHLFALQYLRMEGADDKGCCISSAAAARSLCDALDDLPHLEHLRLAPLPPPLLPRLATLTTLRCLVVKGSNFLGTDGGNVASLLSSVAPSAPLRHLEVEAAGIYPQVPHLPPDALLSFEGHLARLTSLTHLSLTFQSKLSVSMQSLERSVSSLVDLRHLHLSVLDSECEFVLVASLAAVIAPLTQLAHLSVHHLCQRDHVPALAVALRGLTALIHLDLHHCDIVASFPALAPSLTALPAVSHLDLSCNDLNGEDAIALSSALPSLSRLRHLDVSFEDLSPGPAHGFAAALAALPALTFLCLQVQSDGDDMRSPHVDLSVVAAAISSLTCLAHLGVHVENLSPGTAGALSAAFPHLATLSHLDLEGSPMQSDGASVLARGLLCLAPSPLLRLNLSDCLIDNEGMLAVAPALATLSSLHHLDLSNCSIHSEAALALAPAFAALPALRTLNLSFNNFTDVGAAALAPHLRALSSLASLDVGYAGLGTVGAEAILSGVAGLPHLVRIDFSGTRRLPMDCLAAKCPHPASWAAHRGWLFRVPLSTAAS